MAQGISDARIFVRGRSRGGFSCLMPSPVPTSSTSALIEILLLGLPREFVLANRNQVHRGLGQNVLSSDDGKLANDVHCSNWT